MNIEVTRIQMDNVKPNPWNPNVQTERQYEAEIESIVTNGFLSPILVRQLENEYQVIDGEHRLRALKQIKDNKIEGKKNVPDLVRSGEIPAIVIDVDEANAKKLTIIMNETRGRADFAKLGALLTDIKVELPDDILLGLPYTENQLNELMEIASFNWDALEVPVSNTDFDNVDDNGEFKINAVLDSDTAIKWKALLAENKKELPKDSKLAAGALITQLIAKSETV